MKNSIENFFDWKTGKGNSVEKQYQYHKIVSQWERTDVLYGLAEILIEVQGHIVLIFPIFILKGMKNGF